MIRHLKILLLSMVVIGLMSGSAFAAASLNAGNTTLAAERISPTVDYLPAAVNTGYQPGGVVAASSILRVSISGATFKMSQAFDICQNVGATGTSMGAGTTAATGTPSYVDITISAGNTLASGTAYWIQDDACAGLGTPLGSAGSGSIIIPGGTLADTVVSLTVDNKLTPGDPNVYATATAITVVNQFTATLSKVTSKLDFATSMKTFVASAAGTALPYTPTTTQSQAAIVITSNQAVNDLVTVGAGGGACARVLAAGDAVKFKITGDLTGISSIKYGTVPEIYTVTPANRTNGYATASVTGDKLLICYSTDATTTAKKALELTATGSTGTSSIVAGIRTAQITITGDSTGNIPVVYSRDLVAAGTASHDIQLDATQYYIPLVKVGTGTETYIKVQSKATATGSNGVSVAILAGDGSSVTYSAGTITSGTPLTITGTQLQTAVTAAGKTVGDSFAAIVTVNSPNADVFGYANTCDTTGCKRIPVKTVYTAGAAQISE